MFLQLTQNPALMTIMDRFHTAALLILGCVALNCNATPLTREAFGIGFDAANEAPKLDKIEVIDLVYTRGIGRVPITDSVVVTDADDSNLRSASIRISSNYTSTEDFLRFTNQNGIAGVWNKTTGILTLSGRSSVANYQKALRSIQYENTNTINPNTKTRVVSFTVNDGEANSNTLTRNIVINSTNIPPVLSGIETAILAYCPNSGAVIITATIGIQDADNTSLSSANVQITGGYTPGEDFLRFTNQNGIAGSWNSLTGMLTLTGTSLVGNYRTALRSIRYENTNTTNPGSGNHVVTFTVNDGTAVSNAVTRTINVRKRVSAVLSGSTSICRDDASVMLTIYFTGTSPWKFILLRNNANDVEYKGITTDPYTFAVKEEGVYTIKSVSDATCTGDTTGSGYARITYIPSPTATISGTDSICTGGNASLQIALTGTAPWSITFMRNGGNPRVINNITDPNYVLHLTQGGTYTLSNVADALCTGTTSGTGIVRVYSGPSAVISGSTTICENVSADLQVTLTGNAPWRFSYRRNSGNPVEISNVYTSPRLLPVNQSGTYSLYEVYDKNCKGTVSGSAVIDMIPVPEVDLQGLEQGAYNRQSPEWVLLTGTPPGGTYSGEGVIPYDSRWYFVPSLPPVGTYNIVYTYQESSSSCFGSDTAVVRVLEADAIIDFEHGRTKYCQNDPSFTVTGVNMAGATGSFSISGGTGLVDHHNNTATIYPSLLGIGSYTLTYTYYDGTTLSSQSVFDVGNPPIADFAWESECFHAGESISMTNISFSPYGNLTDTSFYWKVQKTGGFDNYTTRDITHTFPQKGNYMIELRLENSYGCTATVSKVLGLRPTIRLGDTTYYEDFEDSPIEWRSGTEDNLTNNSWQFGDPSTGFSGAFSGEKCWYTNITHSPALREQSWVKSPCFDFTGSEKPMLKMRIWRLFNANRDGANVQATIDNGKTWTNVGEIGDGVFWYNSYSILGNPGGKSVGWSNNNSVSNDADWVECRHALDFLTGKTDVQLRIAYGSDFNAQGNNGIAFDDFWIVKRNRTALLEHFTNASDNDCVTADALINSLVNEHSMNFIDLQYHTSFPGADVFNAQNPSIPGARVFYYGLSGVPLTILSGGVRSLNRFDYRDKPLDPNIAIIESLWDSDFGINLNSKIWGNMLQVETQVTAQKPLPASDLSVHVAVIEAVISGVDGGNGETTFESVVKAMLPDAAGTTVYHGWAAGESQVFQNSWQLQNIYDISQLRVVAFLQDENSGEVYQAAMDTIGLISATADDMTGSPDQGTFMVYPNPADNSTTVLFNKEIEKDITLELYDNTGSLAFKRHIPSGTLNTNVPVEGLPEGIYLLRLVSAGRMLGTVKLTVSR
jgi:hypothetical protein